ncbi:MAG TPA: hypothetical protein VE177_05505 [Candidatus Binatus sp.]|nr:hypothetical protein [Candidatus Binatus sp.]
MAAMEETLKAATKKELRILATAWTSRMTEGRWIIQLGYAPDRVKRTVDGFEIYMEAKR